MTADPANQPLQTAAQGVPAVLPGVSDTLVFRVTPDRLSLVGGSGRGAGWSGIVDVMVGDEPVPTRIHGTCRPARMGGDGEPVHVIGPYWARHAVLVPVGAEYLVVFGSSEPLRDPDAAFVSAAAHLVAEMGEIAPAKLLADELEVVHAIRDLMDYRPETLAATCRHIATKAAEPLSCEVGAVLVRSEGRLIAEVVTRDWPARLDPDAIRDTLVTLFRRVERGALVELELESEADDALGREQGLVARFALPIGQPAFGVLVVAHAVHQARGFTNLCQRIGHALAEAAESLVIQAISRESLATDRDRLAQQARVDPLTGLGNRTAWNELLAAEEARRDRYAHPVSVVSVDLDNLKLINDHCGHAAGDRLLRAAADVLRRCARSSDRVARVGGDEFLLLLAETGTDGAARFLARARAAARRVHLGDGLDLRLSVGSATAADGESLEATVCRADAAMYAAKKRHTRRLLDATA
jgi:diguanylate cyclase (GGDEF)-like protein